MDTTEKNIEKLLKKLKANFEPEIIPVIPEDYSTYRQCYGNVDQKVKNDGGKIHYGWIIHKSNLFFEAEHHAVWENENEDLIDVTPNESNHSEILFVSDNDKPYEGIDIDNIRINITNNFLVDDFIFICESLAKLYSFGERKSNLEVIIAEPIVLFINEYTQLKNVFWTFLENGANKFSSCLCGNKKLYKNCHGAILRKKVNEDLKKAELIYQSLKKV